MNTHVSTRQCRKTLTIVWFSFGGGLMVFMIATSLLRRFGSSVSEAWGWFLPTLMPTLSLIVSVLVVDLSAGTDVVEKRVDRFLYRLALYLSCAYLTIMALPFLIQPVIATPVIELMKLSDLWMGPLQGLVAVALGAFFLKREESVPPEAAGATND